MIKIQFRNMGIIDIIWWTRPADVFCWHLKHWKEGASIKDGYCPKHRTPQKNGDWL